MAELEEDNALRKKNLDEFAGYRARPGISATRAVASLSVVPSFGSCITKL
jgi:hypothetical protein